MVEWRVQRCTLGAGTEPLIAVVLACADTVLARDVTSGDFGPEAGLRLDVLLNLYPNNVYSTNFLTPAGCA
eukprot:COSAG01_NODE_18882_length_1047_cov_1.234177_2_plen_71_part_00